MKKHKNLIILSNGSLMFSSNEGVLFKQPKISFCKLDFYNFSFNKKKITKNFEYSKLSKQLKKYFD